MDRVCKYCGKKITKGRMCALCCTKRKLWRDIRQMVLNKKKELEK